MCKAAHEMQEAIPVPAPAAEPMVAKKLAAKVPKSPGATASAADPPAKSPTNIMASQIAPRAVVGSSDPTVPTPELRDKFEPVLRSKEAVERLWYVKCISSCIIVYHIVLIGSLLRNGSSEPAAMAWKAATLFGALYFADVITGLLHIYLDHRRCDVGDPLDMAAYSFRYDHHAFPLNFLKDSPLFPAGSSEIVMHVTWMSLILHAIAYYGYGALPHNLPADSSIQLKVLAGLLAMTGGSVCQTTHALAHEGMFRRNKTFPNTVSLLQRLHVILPPSVHGGHHMEDHDKNFCIFNGWANPMFNRLSLGVFWLMRQFPGHFDALAVPGPNSYAAQQKRKRGEKVD